MAVVPGGTYEYGLVTTGETYCTLVSCRDSPARSSAFLDRLGGGIRDNGSSHFGLWMAKNGHV